MTNNQNGAFTPPSTDLTQTEQSRKHAAPLRPDPSGSPSGSLIISSTQVQFCESNQATSRSPELAHDELSRFCNVLVPLIDHFHQVHGTDRGTITIVRSGNPQCGARDIFRCEIKARTDYVDYLKPTRTAFQSLADYGKLNARLGLMTFEVVQGVDVDFPACSRPKAYCLLRITAPKVFNEAPLREYVVGATEFLRLRRIFGTQEWHSSPLPDVDVNLLVEGEWNCLLSERRTANRLRTVRARQLFSRRLEAQQESAER